MSTMVCIRELIRGVAGFVPLRRGCIIAPRTTVHMFQQRCAGSTVPVQRASFPSKRMSSLGFTQPTRNHAPPLEVLPKQVVRSAEFLKRVKKLRGPDPARPKRPQSAFFRFMHDFRRMHPTKLAGTEAAKAGGAQWRRMQDKEKQPYFAAYQKEHKSYQKLYDEYVASGRKDAWNKDPQKPKKTSSFILFLQNLEAGSNFTIAGKKWKKLAAKEKEPYIQQALKINAQYQKEMEAYKVSGREAQWKEEVGLADAERKVLAKMAKSGEVRRKTSAIKPRVPRPPKTRAPPKTHAPRKTRSPRPPLRRF